MIRTMGIRFFPRIKKEEGVTSNFGNSAKITYQPSLSQLFQSSC